MGKTNINQLCEQFPGLERDFIEQILSHCEYDEAIKTLKSVSAEGQQAARGQQKTNRPQSAARPLSARRKQIETEEEKTRDSVKKINPKFQPVKSRQRQQSTDDESAPNLESESQQGDHSRATTHETEASVSPVAQARQSLSRSGGQFNLKGNQFPVGPEESFTEETRSRQITGQSGFSELTDDVDDPALREIFALVQAYQPETIELEPELKCFIPDYIPAIGDIDPMIKVPPPQHLPKLTAVANMEGKIQPEPLPLLGLTVLDEPATIQSNPALLDLQLRAASKLSTTSSGAIRSIDPNVSAGSKALAQFVQQTQDLHLHKPADRVEYTKRMPEIDDLMREWPESIEQAMSDIALPSASLDIALGDYCRLVCALIGIPVYKGKRGTVESLHSLFTLFSEFNSSQHFGRMGAGNDPM